MRQLTPRRVWVPLLGTFVALLACAAHAVEARFQAVADGVYANVGATGPRSAANEALNANVGLVVTAAGAMLIDGDATFQSARQIHAAVKSFNAAPYLRLLNAAELMPGNASRTYLEIERE